MLDASWPICWKACQKVNMCPPGIGRPLWDQRPYRPNTGPGAAGGTGAQRRDIESRQRYGYRLVVQDRQKYQIWLKDEHARMQEAVPNTVEDRFHYLLALFLRDENYHKIETLSETLWVSTKTLSNELRQVEFASGTIT